MDSMRFTEVETLNKIIFDLYNENVPLHNRIVNFFHQLTGLVYFDKASILFFYKDKDGLYTKHSSISFNWEREQDYVKRYDEYYCHVDDTLPVMDQPSPILFRASTFFNQKLREKTEYWKDYLLPNNCIYSIEGNLQLKSSQGLLGGLIFYRGKEKSDFTENEVLIISLLQSHLSSVLKYYGETVDSTSIVFMLENYHCVGVAMLDSHYQVVRSNPTYRNMISNTDLGHRITERAISLCLNINKSGEQTSEYKFDEAPIFIEVSKISSGEEENAARYCCLIYDLSHFFVQTLNQAKEKYVLTPREFDVLQALLKGKSNEDIASELYLSLPTIKKYLASIYSKMEIKNQKQIFEKLKLQ